MDDPVFVRHFERLGDLLGDRQRVTEGNRPHRDPIGERRTFDEFHDQRPHAIGIFEAVNLRDMWMIE